MRNTHVNLIQGNKIHKTSSLCKIFWINTENIQLDFSNQIRKKITVPLWYFLVKIQKQADFWKSTLWELHLIQGNKIHKTSSLCKIFWINTDFASQSGKPWHCHYGSFGWKFNWKFSVFIQNNRISINI